MMNVTKRYTIELVAFLIVWGVVVYLLWEWTL